MRKITKAALVSGAAAAAIAATVGVAAPAQAHYGAYPHRITTVVTWVGGDSWLSVDYPGEGIVLERSPAKSAIDHWIAYPGDRIGADPIMGDADFISCTLYVDGQYAYSDSAAAGDNTDANCVRDLR